MKGVGCRGVVVGVVSVVGVGSVGVGCHWGSKAFGAPACERLGVFTAFEGIVKHSERHSPRIVSANCSGSKRQSGALRYHAAALTSSRVSLN